MNYFFRFVSLLWHVFSPFLIQLYNEILTLQLDQFLGSRSIQGYAFINLGAYLQVTVFSSKTARYGKEEKKEE
jgi:hypothetical protein